MKLLTEEQLNKKVKRKKIFKRIIKIITYPILAAILSVSIYAFIQRMINPDKIIDVFGYKAFSVNSGSMEDTLKVGDLIIIKKPKNENLMKVGDIITFRENNYIITHRIVEIKEIENKKYYITKGDNNSAIDENKVSFENIEGICVRSFHDVGRIVLIAQNTNVIIMVGFLLYLIYCFFSDREDRNIARHIKRKKTEDEK